MIGIWHKFSKLLLAASRALKLAKVYATSVAACLSYFLKKESGAMNSTLELWGVGGFSAGRCAAKAS